MALFEYFPYTNLQDLNLGMLLKDCKTLDEKVDKLNDIIENLNVDEFVNNYLDTHMNEVLAGLRGAYIVNVADCVESPLSDDNIVEAINKALELSDRIYIPKGDFTFNIEIYKNCTMYLDPETHFSTNNNKPCIYAENVSFSLIGGNVKAGVDDDSRIPLHSTTHEMDYSIIQLNECHDGQIKNVNVPYSKYGNVFRLFNCNNYIFQHIKSTNTLSAVIGIVDTCRNITVDSCKFENLKIMNGKSYCYAVYVSIKRVNDPDYIVDPADNIIMTNNYVNESEDCALDSHGSKNTNISNNVVLNTVNAITAYNDNGRVTRPSGWKMENVLISNNYCKSSRTIPTGTITPHGYIFVGARNYNQDYDAYSNCRIINNYFSSPNGLAYEGIKAGLIFTSGYVRNFIVENNIIDCQNVNRPIRFNNAINFRFANNEILNGDNNGFIQVVSSIGEWINNTNCRGYIGNNLPSIITNINNSLFKPSIYYMLGGQIYFIGTNTYISRHLGYRLNPLNEMGTDYKKTFTVTTVNGISTIDGDVPKNNPYLPGLAVVYDGTNPAYVFDTISTNKLKLTTSAGVPIPDGTHTVTVKDADPQTI